MGVLRRERDTAKHLAHCRKSPAGSGLIGLLAANAAGGWNGGAWSCHHVHGDQSSPMFAELLALVCGGAVAVDLPRLAHLAPGAGVAGTVTLVMHDSLVSWETNYRQCEVEPSSIGPETEEVILLEAGGLQAARGRIFSSSPFSARLASSSSY